MQPLKGSKRRRRTKDQAPSGSPGSGARATVDPAKNDERTPGIAHVGDEAKRVQQRGTLFPPAPLIEEDEARNARRSLELQDMLLNSEVQFGEFSEWIVTHPLPRALLQVCGN